MADGNVTDVTGAQPAAPGYDHVWFPWSPLPARPPLVWPDGAHVAVSVVLDLGAVEWEETPPAVPPVGGRGVGVYPDFPRMSHREFGHRVGIFRLLDMLHDLDIRPAAIVDVLTAEHYVEVIDHLRPAVGELVAGGLSASRPITSLMTEDEERHYIATSMDRLIDVLGVRPAGWRSPEHSESSRTPGLLAQAGLQYLLDWCNDDRPYPMSAEGDVWAFPLSWELSDVAAVHIREVSAEDYGASLTEAFDVLSDEGATSGRVLALHLHPWLSGQPFRASAVYQALRHIHASGTAWITTPHEIVNWCRQSN